MNFLLSIIKGIFIGAGAILPGISSGVLCVIFGIYEKLVNSVLEIFKDFKNNFKFLFPIALGGLIGFLLFGNLLNYFFSLYENECKLLFLGLILGSIPSLFKYINNQNQDFVRSETATKSKFRHNYILSKLITIVNDFSKNINKKKNFHLSFLIYTLISFCFGLFLFLLEKNISHFCFGNLQNNFIILFLSGFAMSAGIIVPGISSTVILMCFGTYYLYLESISTLNLSVLLPMGLGVICGSILFLFLIRFLFKNYSQQTYYSIIGFVLGSIFVLVPNNFNFVSFVLFVFGFVTSLKLE